MGLGEWIAEHFFEKTVEWLGEKGGERVAERAAERALERTGERVGERVVETGAEKAAQNAFVRLEQGSTLMANGEKAVFGVTKTGERKLLQGAELKAAEEALAREAEEALARTTAEAGQRVAQEATQEGARLTASGAKQALETETTKLVQEAGQQVSDQQFRQLLEQSGAGAAEKGFLSKAFESATTKGPLRIYLGKGDLAAKLSALERVAAKGDSATAKACENYANLLLGKAGISAKGIEPAELAAIKAMVNGESALGKSILENATKVATERGVERTATATFAQRMSNMGTFAKEHPLRATFAAAAAGGSLAVNTVKFGFKTAWWMATHKTATALIIGAGIAVDEVIDDGRIVNAIGNSIVKPAAKSLGEKAVELGDKGLAAAGLPPFLHSLFNTGSGNGNGSANGEGNGNGAGNENEQGGHWWDSLKRFASSLTGPWAILGAILSVVAWIGEAIGGLASSLFSSDTRVQTNNPGRVASVQGQAGPGQQMRATTYDHSGERTGSVLDRPVPELAPAPGQ